MAESEHTFMPAMSDPRTVLPSGQLPKDLRVKADVDAEFLAEAMKALANPARLRLLSFLSQARYLEEIAKEMRVTRNAASRHIKVLEEAGLVARVPGTRDKAPVVDYVVVQERLFRLFDETRRLAVATPRRAATPPDLWRTVVLEAGGAGRSAREGARFVEVYGLDVGGVHKLDPGKRDRVWIVGRGQEADVRLPGDPYASQKHAHVKYDQGFRVVDGFSTNGTRLNDAKLEPGKEAPLRHGDLLEVGRTMLLFHSPV
jgi:DNA-binding transcriptional ArsR family regulator